MQGVMLQTAAPSTDGAAAMAALIPRAPSMETLGTAAAMGLLAARGLAPQHLVRRVPARPPRPLPIPPPTWRQATPELIKSPPLSVYSPGPLSPWS